MVKTTRIIYHKQLLLTKNILPYWTNDVKSAVRCKLLNHWRQHDVKSAARCRLLNHWRQRLLTEPLTLKTWAQGCVIQQREKWPRVKSLQVWAKEIFWMNNKAIIIEFGFRRIWRIQQISEGVIHTLLDMQNSSYPTQPHSIIANYIITLATQVF